MHAALQCLSNFLITLIPTSMHTHSMRGLTHVHTETVSWRIIATRHCISKGSLMIQTGKKRWKNNNLVFEIKHMRSHTAYRDTQTQSKQYRSPANQLCKTLTNTHTLNSALCLLLSHTNCQHPAQSMCIQKAGFPRTETFILSFLCVTHYKALPQGSDGRRIFPSFSSSWQQQKKNWRYTGRQWEMTQTDTHRRWWANTTDSNPPPLLTLTPHFHFYGMLPSAEGLLLLADTR